MEKDKMDKIIKELQERLENQKVLEQSETNTDLKKHLYTVSMGYEKAIVDLYHIAIDMKFEAEKGKR